MHSGISIGISSGATASAAQQHSMITSAGEWRPRAAAAQNSAAARYTDAPSDLPSSSSDISAPATRGTRTSRLAQRYARRTHQVRRARALTEQNSTPAAQQHQQRNRIATPSALPHQQQQPRPLHRLTFKSPAGAQHSCINIATAGVCPQHRSSTSAPAPAHKLTLQPQLSFSHQPLVAHHRASAKVRPRCAFTQHHS